MVKIADGQSKEVIKFPYLFFDLSVDKPTNGINTVLLVALIIVGLVVITVLPILIIVCVKLRQAQIDPQRQRGEQVGRHFQLNLTCMMK